MQTQCPHCKTRFRVTETQVNTADGFVRCGVCKEVFNAFEVAKQHDHQHSLLNDERSEYHSAVIEDKTEQTVLRSSQNTYQVSDVTEHSEIYAENKPLNTNETPVIDESQKDIYDFFNKEDNESLQHIVPDNLRDSYSSQSHSAISTLLWSFGILLLTATLAIEYAWFNRDQLSQIPELQAGIEKLCQQFECKKLSIRDPSKIELITRNIYSHPNEKKALMVNVTMKNNAEFAQPYPVMQIDFSDIRGGTVAARRFLPAEYLAIESQQANTEQQRLLQPNTSTHVTLEIQDPGKQAMTYEFNFL